MSLLLLLVSPFPFPSLPGLFLLVLLRTFLQTGLFIVGHDAMHGSLMPRHRRLNDGIGVLALQLYAFLPYGQCRRNHFRHHQAPAEHGDPDYHDGQHSDPFHWYARFMQGYLSAGQLLALFCCWTLTALVLRSFTEAIPEKILFFWIVPLLLSSIQLFVFGTYLPHRGRANDGPASAQVRSTSLPPFLSLLSCYHFGYHWEHHAFPAVPWHALPALRKAGAGGVSRPGQAFP
jgi:beta-carotene ketolase (CrtW type)